MNNQRSIPRLSKEEKKENLSNDKTEGIKSHGIVAFNVASRSITFVWNIILLSEGKTELKAFISEFVTTQEKSITAWLSKSD